MELPDCPGCDAAGTLEPIDHRPGWYVCWCCAYRVYIVNGEIVEIYRR